MAGKTYVTKGRNPNYSNIPAQQGGYDPVNPYAVVTKTIERVRAPIAKYKDLVGSPSKAALLNEYVHSHSLPVSPKYEPSNSNPHVSPNKNLFSSPTRGYFTEESNRVNSGSGLETGFRNVLNGNMSLKSPTTNVNEPLANPTTNVKEPLAEESVYYSPRADPRRRGALDNLSTRAQPVEPHKRYARPAFVARSNNARYNFTN